MSVVFSAVLSAFINFRRMHPCIGISLGKQASGTDRERENKHHRRPPGWNLAKVPGVCSPFLSPADHSYLKLDFGNEAWKRLSRLDKERAPGRILKYGSFERRTSSAA